MSDLGALSSGDYAPLVGSAFEVRPPAIEDLLILQLTEVAVAEGAGANGRPFLLYFRGPVEPLLAQDSHELVHERLGTGVLFLGPVAQDSEGTTYVAVFN